MPRRSDTGTRRSRDGGHARRRRGHRSDLGASRPGRLLNQKYPPITFERLINGHHDIFITNADGTEETNLTRSSGVDYGIPTGRPATATPCPSRLRR
jgi:hypothetical protein